MDNPLTSVVPASILIVDDNRENLHLLASVLAQQGYTVRAVPDGRLALASVEAEFPDLILLDIFMPGMDGYQVCTRLKADERTRDIPVIFISVAAEVFDKVKAFSVGGVDYITKPFQVEEVLARVDTHLSLRAMQKQLEEKNAQLEKEIAERRQAEEALRESEASYRELANSITDVFFAFDEDLRYTYWNKASENLTGIPAQDAIGKSLYELFPDTPQTRRAEREYLGVLRTQRPQTFVIEYQLGGQDFFFEISAYPSRGGISVFTKDITERKRAEEALRDSEEKLRHLFESVSDGIFAMDLKGAYTQVNQGMLEIHGLSSRDEILGKSGFEFVARHDVERAMASMQETLEQGAVVRQEFRALKADGSELPVEVNGTVLRDASGSPVGFIGVVRDIAERKRAEQTLRTQRDLGLALSTTRDLEETLRLCVEAAIRVSGMDCGGAYLVDDTSGSLDLAFHKGLPPDFLESASHYAADSANARLVMAGKPIYVQHQELAVPLDEAVQRERLRAVAVIPVSYEDRAIACLNVASHTLDEVPDFARAALETIATQIGSAITRSKAREALRQSQANLQTLFNSLEDLLFVLDMEGHILDVNPVVLKRLGYSRAELAGEHVLKVHPPERHEEAAAIIADMVAGKTDSCPVPVMAKDGAQIPVETKITRGRWGGREAIFGISRDITERKEAERQVQLLGQIVQQMRDAVILTSSGRKSRIQYVNDAFSEIYGYAEEEVLGKPSWILFAGDEEERKRLSEERREAIARTGEGRLEYRDRRKDGGIFWVSNTLSVIDVEGTLYNLGIVRDITARKRAEEKLDSAIQELQVALAKVRTLSGLLPICANCNKIRDDQGYWQDVAVYVAQHSEAEFSHGICPDCKRELYPPEVYPFLYEDDE